MELVCGRRARGLVLASCLFSPPVWGFDLRHCFNPRERRGALKDGRDTEEQIAYVLHAADTGTSIAEVSRKRGISEQKFYC
jgi:hypothetical protein